MIEFSFPACLFLKKTLTSERQNADGKLKRPTADNSINSAHATKTQCCNQTQQFPLLRDSDFILFIVEMMPGAFGPQKPVRKHY